MAACFLELVGDTAFAAPPISAAHARDMLAQLRVRRLIEGYRGGADGDEDAVVAGLVALGQLAEEAGDVIESVDINPFVALGRGSGGMALDALMVLRGAGSEEGEEQ